MSDPIRRLTSAQGHLERWIRTEPAWPESSVQLDACDVTLVDRFAPEGIERRYRCTHDAFLDGTFKKIIQSQFGGGVWSEIQAEVKRRAAALPSPSLALETPPAPAVKPVAVAPAPKAPAPEVKPVVAAPQTPPVVSRSVAGRAVVIQGRSSVNVGLVAGLIAAVEGFDIAAFLRRVRAGEGLLVQGALSEADANSLRDRLHNQGLGAEVAVV